MRRSTAPPPTEAEIMAHHNVPVEMAAKYIGWSTPSITNALKQGRAPFGFAAENPATHTFSYNISPGMLVRFKRGELAVYPLKEIIEMFKVLASAAS